MKRLLLQIFLPTILIGTIMFTCWFFISKAGKIEDLTALYTKDVTIGNYTKTFYIIDIHKYLTSLKFTLDITNAFKNTTFPEIFTPNWSTSTVENLKQLGLLIINGFINSLNVVIWTINCILLLPIKLIFYIYYNIISLLGLNMANLDVQDFIKNTYNIKIDYIDYIN